MCPTHPPTHPTGYSYLLADGHKFGVVLDPRISGIQMMASNYGLVALNLFLPLAISVLRAMSASMTPYSKYTALRIATVKIQTEIYTYRTKTGKYNTRKVQKKDKKKDDKNGGGGGEGGGGGSKKGEEDFKPSKLLGQAMDGVWADLLASDIQKGALIAPQLFYDPMDSSNLIINSNLRLQKMLTENLKPPPKNMLLKGMYRPTYRPTTLPTYHLTAYLPITYRPVYLCILYTHDMHPLI